MQSITLLTTYLALLLLLLLLLPTTTLTQSTGWANSCFTASLDDTILEATYYDINGGYRSTSLDLNLCFTNNNGNIDCAQLGNFGSTCENCNAIGGNTTTSPISSNLSCNCFRDDGSLNLGASIDTNTCVGNQNGQLVGSNIVGSQEEDRIGVLEYAWLARGVLGIGYAGFGYLRFCLVLGFFWVWSWLPLKM